MFAPETVETAEFKQRKICAAVQVERDKFCRRCGASQSISVESSNPIPVGEVNVTVASSTRIGFETSPLPGSGSLRRSYSGALIKIVTQQFSDETFSPRPNRWLKLLISMLVAPALWLMIVLLSPLDAYVVAKDLANRV